MKDKVEPVDISDRKSSFLDEEITFNFTNQKTNLTKLNRKIIEFLEVDWPKIDSRQNKEYKTFEIIARRNSSFTEMWSGHKQVMILIKGESDNFTVTFYLSNGVVPAILPGPVVPVMNEFHNYTVEKIRIVILRTVEELVYSSRNYWD